MQKEPGSAAPPCLVDCFDAAAQTPERVSRLTDTVVEGLGAVLSLLTGLPAKNGRKFFVETEDFKVGDDGAVCGAVTLSHKAVNAPQGAGEPGLKLVFRESAGKPLELKVVRLYESSEHNILSDFDEMRREVALGISQFAPERVGDVVKAIGRAAVVTGAPVTAAPAAQASQLNL